MLCRLDRELLCFGLTLIMTSLSDGWIQVAYFGIGQVSGGVDGKVQSWRSKAQGTRKSRETTFEWITVDEDWKGGRKTNLRMFVCLFIYLFICLSVCLFVYSFIRSFIQSVSQLSLFCLSIRLSILLKYIIILHWHKKQPDTSTNSAQ